MRKTLETISLDFKKQGEIKGDFGDQFTPNPEIEIHVREMALALKV